MQSTAEGLFFICEMNRGLAGYNGIKDERAIIYLKAAKCERELTKVGPNLSI